MPRGLRERLIEVMLGMASPHLAFHIVNKGIFSGTVSNKRGGEKKNESTAAVVDVVVVHIQG